MPAIVTLTDEQMALIRQSIDCASAISFENGHEDQAKMFRDLKSVIPEPFFTEPRPLTDQHWFDSNISNRNERNAPVVAQMLFEMMANPSSREDKRKLFDTVLRYLKAFSKLH